MQCLFALSEDQRSRRCGEKHMSETVTGYIDHVIFRNEDNGYTVMVLKGTKKEEELTCVGSFPAITQGASIEATGVYIHHPVYGKQFQISSFTEKMPEDTYGIERYLGSGAIRGIGAALAARIVRKFGDDTDGRLLCGCCGRAAGAQRVLWLRRAGGAGSSGALLRGGRSLYAVRRLCARAGQGRADRTL